VILAELRGPLSPVALGWPNVGSSSALTMRTRDLARRAHVAAAFGPLVALLAKIGAGQPDDGVAASEAAGVRGRDNEGPTEELACDRRGIVTYGPGSTRVAVAVPRRSA